MYGTQRHRRVLADCAAVVRVRRRSVRIHRCSSAPMAASEDRISVSCGPMKFETKNCVPANAMPHAAAAGSTPSGPPSAHHHDQVRRHEQRDRRADAAHAGAQAIDGSPVVTASVMIGIRDGAEGHWRRVGQQADGGGVEGRESETGEHGRSHRDRRPESGGAFDERAEGERDQERLQLGVFGEVPRESLRISNLPLSSVMR